jgi:hypothetical protein
MEPPYIVVLVDWLVSLVDFGMYDYVWSVH